MGLFKSAGRALRRASRNVASGTSDVFQASTYSNMAADAGRVATQYMENPEMAALAIQSAGGSVMGEQVLAGLSRAVGQSGMYQGILGKGADPWAYAMEGSQKAAANIGIGNQPTAPTGDEPPGYDYANDPNYQQQFTRLRKAARMLGRAGTYKNRGATSLGTDSPLGTPMQLTGA